MIMLIYTFIILISIPIVYIIYNQLPCKIPDDWMIGDLIHIKTQSEEYYYGTYYKDINVRISYIHPSLKSFMGYDNNIYKMCRNYKNLTLEDAKEKQRINMEKSKKQTVIAQYIEESQEYTDFKIQYKKELIDLQRKYGIN